MGFRKTAEGDDISAANDAFAESSGEFDDTPF
jgi:hypothetical protein